MKQLRARLGVIQNLGWLDRVIRIAVGTAMLAYPVYQIATSETVEHSWMIYSMLISIYPFFTAILGYDPIYAQFVVRTCDTSERNPCGTFPYEVDAALGHRPIPKSNVERSLENSRHER